DQRCWVANMSYGEAVKAQEVRDAEMRAAGRREGIEEAAQLMEDGFVLSDSPMESHIIKWAGRGIRENLLDDERRASPAPSTETRPRLFKSPDGICRVCGANRDAGENCEVGVGCSADLRPAPSTQHRGGKGWLRSRKSRS